MASNNWPPPERRTLRTAFEENYKAVSEPANNRQGYKMRYVYIGLWYVWNIPPQRVKTMKRLVGGACGLSVLLFLAGGLMNSPVNYARYVQLPGLLSIAALLFEIIGSVQFCAAKERMDCMDFRDIRGKLLVAPLLHSVLLLCTAAAAVCQMARGGFAPAGLFVVLCYTVSAILSLGIFFSIRTLPYRTEKNTGTG